MKKNHMEILKLKTTTMTEIKNPPEGLSSRFKVAEGSISELEDTSIETIYSEKKKRIKKI